MIDIQQVKTGVHCGIRGSPALEGCLHSYHIWNLDWSSINFFLLLCLRYIQRVSCPIAWEMRFDGCHF